MSTKKTAGKIPSTGRPSHEAKELAVAIQEIPISKLKGNPKNPRVLRDAKFAKLKKSIQDFPDMLNYRTIVAVTDGDKYMVLGGNMRLRAMQELGIKTAPVMLADHWTEEQRREFTIKDNVGFGEWNWDDLANEWGADDLEDWGLDLPKDPLPPDEDQEDYMPGFRLVIECTSEAQQQQYFKEITNLGIECKPLTL